MNLSSLSVKLVFLVFQTTILSTPSSTANVNLQQNLQPAEDQFRPGRMNLDPDIMKNQPLISLRFVKAENLVPTSRKGCTMKIGGDAKPNASSGTRVRVVLGPVRRHRLQWHKGLLLKGNASRLNPSQNPALKEKKLTQAQEEGDRMWCRENAAPGKVLERTRLILRIGHTLTSEELCACSVLVEWAGIGSPCASSTFDGGMPPSM